VCKRCIVNGFHFKLSSCTTQSVWGKLITIAYGHNYITYHAWPHLIRQTLLFQWLCYLSHTMIFTYFSLFVNYKISSAISLINISAVYLKLMCQRSNKRLGKCIPPHFGLEKPLSINMIKIYQQLHIGMTIAFILWQLNSWFWQ